MKLHDYQEVAKAFLLSTPRAGLFLDMGLGKTATTLSALTPDHLPALVVAPKRVAETVWHTEARLWRPDLRVAVAKGNPAARAKELARDVDITVIGRDNLADLTNHNRGYRTLVIDELSGFKSRKSTRWKLARALALRMTYVWGLSGTPTPNGLMDLWAQLYLLDGGERLGTALTRFRAAYFTPGRQLPSGVITRWDLIPGMDKIIHAKIDDICLSMETDGRVPLPEVTHNEIVVELPPAAKAAYKAMRTELVADLDLIGGEIHTAGNPAILTSKLSQITAGFLYVDDADLRDGAYDRIHDEKTKAVAEVVEAAQGSPVLVFYRYRAELEALRAAFPAARTIADPDVIESWNAGEVPILLAHPQSAGHGLNLQHGGHTIVWTSLPYSLEEWKQANKRLARQGQKHPVVIHRIMAKRSIDYVDLARLTRKGNVEQALLDHLESPI